MSSPAPGLSIIEPTRSVPRLRLRTCSTSPARVTSGKSTRTFARAAARAMARSWSVEGSPGAGAVARSRAPLLVASSAPKPRHGLVPARRSKRLLEHDEGALPRGAAIASSERRAAPLREDGRAGMLREHEPPVRTRPTPSADAAGSARGASRYSTCTSSSEVRERSHDAGLHSSARISITRVPPFVGPDGDRVENSRRIFHPSTGKRGAHRRVEDHVVVVVDRVGDAGSHERERDVATPGEDDGMRRVTRVAPGLLRGRDDADHPRRKGRDDRWGSAALPVGMSTRSPSRPSRSDSTERSAWASPSSNRVRASAGGSVETRGSWPRGRPQLMAWRPGVHLREQQRLEAP